MKTSFNKRRGDCSKIKWFYLVLIISKFELYREMLFYSPLQNEVWEKSNLFSNLRAKNNQLKNHNNNK